MYYEEGNLHVDEEDWGSATALKLKGDKQRSRVCDGSVAEKKKQYTLSRCLG